MELSDRLKKYLHSQPQIDTSAYVHPSAVIIGDVKLSENVSVWPHVTLRADINKIRVGACSNIQDGTVFHLSDEYPVTVGKYVTIGHGAIVHACTIEDNCLIGMHATILDGAVIGKGSIIGAKALVPSESIIPPGSLVLGVPGKVVRKLSAEEQERIEKGAQKYVELGKAYKEKFST